MKHNQKLLNIAVAILALALIILVIWGYAHKSAEMDNAYADGIQQIDLDTIHLQASDVEVNFSDIILSLKC